MPTIITPPETSPIDTSNVVFIEFADPEIRSKFPKGVWNNEPDYCAWELFDLRCVMIRDVDLGIWKGGVGVKEGHLFFGKTLKHIVDEKLYVHLPKVHGGISWIGELSPHHKELNKRYWFLGFETSQGNDLIPILSQSDNRPKSKIIASNSTTYRTFKYVRGETNSLAQALNKIGK